MKGVIGKPSLQKSIQDARAIASDQDYVDRAITPEGFSRERNPGPGMAARRLRKDSDEGRYAAPGFGDVGQFIGANSNQGMLPLPNSKEQYESERQAGDPNALRLSFSEWQKL